MVYLLRGEYRKGVILQQMGLEGEYSPLLLYLVGLGPGELGLLVLMLLVLVLLLLLFDGTSVSLLISAHCSRFSFKFEVK